MDWWFIGRLGEGGFGKSGYWQLLDLVVVSVMF